MVLPAVKDPGRPWFTRLASIARIQLKMGLFVVPTLVMEPLIATVSSVVGLEGLQVREVALEDPRPPGPQVQTTQVLQRVRGASCCYESSTCTAWQIDENT